MHTLMYFDVEDSFSPPDSPVHRLPAQFADILRSEGLRGCFHIIGEKARFMERHRQHDVIEALRHHDISLHYDRGSLPPTTAVEVSNLGWFDGVERTLFRERTGFDALERIFGRCSALTQHGGTFAAQIVYAAGKMGKPYFYSPFSLAGRNVVWYANNLMLRGLDNDFIFDALYRDTPAFDARLADVAGYIAGQVRAFDFSPVFGCHPVFTMMTGFPCSNFFGGATPPRAQWRAPTAMPGVSIPTILANFRRFVQTLVAQPGLAWTTVGEMSVRYGMRPVVVTDAAVLAGARAVVDHGGPTHTQLLSAGEVLYLLARRRLAAQDRYDVPQVMGPTHAGTTSRDQDRAMSLDALAEEIVAAVDGSSYLPADADLAVAIMRLASAALGGEAATARRAIADAPGVAEALGRIRTYREWAVHGPAYNQAEILSHAERQCWTLKPAMPAADYPTEVVLGSHLNPMVPWR